MTLCVFVADILCEYVPECMYSSEVLCACVCVCVLPLFYHFLRYVFETVGSLRKLTINKCNLSDDAAYECVVDDEKSFTEVFVKGTGNTFYVIVFLSSFPSL